MGWLGPSTFSVRASSRRGLSYLESLALSIGFAKVSLVGQTQKAKPKAIGGLCENGLREQGPFPLKSVLNGYLWGICY